MKPEEYWEQTKRKWEETVADPRGDYVACGFCVFTAGRDCDCCCPVFKVYGSSCCSVDPVRAYYDRQIGDAGVEELSVLAEAVVQELDDKKEELIAAMETQMSEEYYCPEHRFNPPHYSGLCFCPYCELEASQVF